MTEQFGICGVGWRYEIDRVWNEPAPSGQEFAFAEIALYIKQNDKWSDPIPGIGGSMLVEQESSGLHASDEGYKMAITDALSVAMKMLGVGADVYAGLWDGARYRDQIAQPATGRATMPNEAPQSSEMREHWCKEHNTAFFMRGKMKSFAHPIGDTGEWCHEHKEQADAIFPPEQKAAESPPTSPAIDLNLKNPGEFYQACLHHFKLNKSDVDKEVSMYDLSNPGQRKQAWQSIVGIYGNK